MRIVAADRDSLQPTPGAMVASVLAAMHDPWPSSRREVQQRLRDLGIAPHTAQGPERRHDVRAWHSAEVPAWPSATAGWTTLDHQLVGMHWFIWGHLPSRFVYENARTVVLELSARLGQPTDRIERPEEHAGTWYWLLDDHVVDMYAHPAISLGERLPTGQCVQIHVDRRRMAEALEAADRAHQRI